MLRPRVPGHTPADEMMTRMLALLLAQVEQVNAWLGEHGLFRGDPVLASQTIDPVLLRPWRWNFGSRVYVVWALVFRRKAGRP